ncbi:unnamed protein product [Paramecium octaurelia]|uniref:Uncharacterized protein n=1 Tax=Paramecium octaurelia TaxID=43137 RepID=A0A8S1V2E5_PAROT|nr:unnamed protein product [Paramecium octaurelia]
MDIYQSNLCSTYVFQLRQAGIKPVLSLISYANVNQLELNDQVQLDKLFHEILSNNAYLLSYNDIDQDQMNPFSMPQFLQYQRKEWNFRIQCGLSTSHETLIVLNYGETTPNLLIWHKYY